MDLRALKKEMDSQPRIQQQLQAFQLSWVKPLRAHHSPLAAHLNRDLQQKVKKQLSTLTPLFAILRQDSLIQEKLQHQSRYLVELKLNLMQGNESRCQQLIRQLLTDPFLNIKQSLTDAHHLEQNITRLVQEYSKTNALLEKHLSLEGALLYTDLPHQQHLDALQQTVQRQMSLSRKIAEQFIAVTREMKAKTDINKTNIKIKRKAAS